MRKTHVKLTLPGKHTAQGLRWGPQLDSLNKDNPGCFRKATPLPYPLGAMAA